MESGDGLLAEFVKGTPEHAQIGHQLRAGVKHLCVFIVPECKNTGTDYLLLL